MIDMKMKTVMIFVLGIQTAQAGFIQENVILMNQKNPAKSEKKFISKCESTTLNLDAYQKYKISFFSAMQFECQKPGTAVVCLKGTNALSFNYFDDEASCNEHQKAVGK